MPRITKAIIKASLNPEKLYSKAEDVVLQMKQDKMQGKDLEGFLKGKQVKDEEIRELGIDELFHQKTVTRADLLEKIDENRIEFEEEIAIGGRESDVDFDVQQMEMEEYFGGPSGVEAEMDFDLEENIKDYYYTEFVDQADDTLDERELNLKKWSQNELDFDDLPSSLQNELRQNAYENVSTMYYDDPATVVQLYVDGNPVEGYRLVQSPYDNAFLPTNDASPSLQREFGVDRNNATYGRQDTDTSVTSVNEAQVRLSQHALDQGEMELAGDTRWADYTVDGGKNYREIRYRLAGPEKFREGTHFPDDVNNVFHARVTDRVDTDGNNVLFVEELQSDWAQQGRRSGFKDPEVIARGEDEIRSAFEANDLNKILSDFEANVEYPNALSFLKELHNAGRPGAGGGYREKMSKLSRFLRDYRRNLENQKEYHVIDFLEDNLSDKDKIELARYEVDLANDRVGATGLDARYKMPDLDTEKGRDELDVLVRQNLKRQNRSMSAGNQPTQQVSKILFEQFPVASPGAGYDLLEGQAERRAKAYLDNLIEGNGLPPNIVSAVEDTIDRVRPGLTSDLREEAMKPQAAPFVRDSNAWNKLAVKRLITIAADEGYDKVMFSPSEVQIDRWGEEGLRGQYDVNIPKAIKQVTGSKPGQTTFRSDYGTIIGPSIDLDQKTPTGETVAERAKAGQTMFAVPLAAAAGLAGLAAPDMAEAGEVPIDEGIGRLPKSSGEERGVLEEVGDFLRYGPEVGLDALNAMIVRPIAGSTAGRLAYDLGGDPEQIRKAQAETEALVDYEASPGAEAYGQRILGGIGELLESEAAQKAAPYVAPVLDALEQASEGLTSGIIGLNERMYGDDDDERTDAFLEVIRPGIEATQPI